jgi:glycyl-tRNA synthetase alpha chain
LDLDPCSVEITYGLERIAMFLNNADSCFDLAWSSSTSYRAIRMRDEVEFSRYNFERQIPRSISNGSTSLKRGSLALIEIGLVSCLRMTTA